jgi:NAD(P)H-hydrate epimerase
MTRDNSGDIVVRDIGIPDAAKRETGPGEFLFFPTPDRARGRSGRVVVIGGGPFTGAPQLSALAALRSGAERATVIAPEPAAGRIQSGSPDLVVVPIGERRFGSEDVPAVRDALRQHRHSAVVGGMGAGRDEDTVAAFRQIFAKLPPEMPVLADADALEALVRPKDPGASRGTDRPKERAVATPNEGEYQRLFGQSSSQDLAGRLAEVQRHAREAGLTIVAKGEADLLSDGERAFANRHQNSAGTVGGVGDVLSGVIGSLLAQGLDALDAARLGTRWVAAAGNRAFDAKSYGLVATDVIGELPAVLRDSLGRLRDGAS